MRHQIFAVLGRFGTFHSYWSALLKSAIITSILAGATPSPCFSVSSIAFPSSTSCPWCWPWCRSMSWSGSRCRCPWSWPGESCCRSWSWPGGLRHRRRRCPCSCRRPCCRIVAAALALIAELSPGLVGVAAAIANALAPVPGLVEVAITTGLGLEVAGADGPGLEVAGPAFRRSFFSLLRSSMGLAWLEA